jgi:hypothetical protein
VKRHSGRPVTGDLTYTALEEFCPDCARTLPVYQVISSVVERLDGAFRLVHRDKRCGERCPGARPIFYAPRDLRVVLPGHVYGLDVTLYVGERHLVHRVSLAQATRELKDKGLPIDQRHTGRVFRDFLALASLKRGDDAALQGRLRAQGGIVLMCDGVQFDDRSPPLYLIWDAISGTPLFGERMPCRAKADLKPLLVRVRNMQVPIIGVVTDKEKGLVPAVQEVFPDVRYQLCQTHFLKNCGKPIESDLSSLQGSVARRTDAARAVAKRAQRRTHTAPEPDPCEDDTASTVSSKPAQASESSQTPSASGSPEASLPEQASHPSPIPSESALTPEVPAPRTEEEGLLQEVSEMIRVNSRVTGKDPLDPAALKRHDRLQAIRGFVNEAKDAQRVSSDGRRQLEELSNALKPTWHEAHTAGRVRRHTEIIRGLAHELSASPDRPDRPASAEEAKGRVEAYLEAMATSAPRKGLGAATATFVDDLRERYGRYGMHLFHCFDDDRIPATTNDLERFNGDSKGALRQSLGCGSTTNSVVTNLGDEALLAWQQLRQTGPPDPNAFASTTPEAFRAARARIANKEAPAVARRSMVRHLATRLDYLRAKWLKKPACSPSPELNA